MEMLQKTNLVSEQLPNTFTIIFMSAYKGGSIVDRLLAFGINKVQKFFGYTGEVAHLAIALGNTVYELTMEGFTSYPLTVELLESERVLGCWRLDLKEAEIGEDAIISAYFVLNQLKANDKKLRPVECLKYVLSMWKAYRQTFDGEQESFATGKTEVVGGTLMFTLPTTCCTPATLAMWQLLGMEPNYDDLCPMAWFSSCIIFAKNGIGELLMKDNVCLIVK